jgi:hypothetical protein
LARHRDPPCNFVEKVAVPRPYGGKSDGKAVKVGVSVVRRITGEPELLTKQLCSLCCYVAKVFAIIRVFLTGGTAHVLSELVVDYECEPN